MMRLSFFVCALMVLGTVSAQAQDGTYYRWKDASGVTHYGDAPPAKGQATPVKVNGAQPSAASPVPAAATAGNATTDAATRMSVLEQADKAAKARNCATAQQNIKILSGNAMLVDSANPNTAKRMTADQVALAQRTAQAEADANCAKAAP